MHDHVGMIRAQGRRYRKARRQIEALLDWSAVDDPALASFQDAAAKLRRLENAYLGSRWRSRGAEQRLSTAELLRNRKRDT